jgi:hypothetical protein
VTARAVLCAVALAAAALPAGCSETVQCTANADCPVQYHCVPVDAGLAGVCVQECRATADCRDPARRCDSLGRCVSWELPPLDAAPDRGAAGDGATGDADAGDDGPLDAGAGDDATSADAALLPDAAPTDGATAGDGAG